MNVPIRRLVAGVATLQPDDPVLRAALDLSARTGAELHLLHVDSPQAVPEAAFPLGRSRALTALAESVSPRATTTGRVACRMVTGSPERVLRGAATALGADLLVLGPTRRGRLAGAVLGTTAGQVLRGTRVPMLVMRQPLPDRPLRVLLATDLSHHSAHAHSRGVALSRALAVAGEPELRSLYVRPPELAEMPVPPVWPADDAEAELSEFVRAEVPRARVTPRVRGGDPAQEILAEAREWQADVIVVGTHGRRGIGRMFLGSVAETVLRHASCAVLVIPPVRLYSLARDPETAGASLAGV